MKVHLYAVDNGQQREQSNVQLKVILTSIVNGTTILRIFHVCQPQVRGCPLHNKPENRRTKRKPRLCRSMTAS